MKMFFYFYFYDNVLRLMDHPVLRLGEGKSILVTGRGGP
jgi:hypothetical protein